MKWLDTSSLKAWRLSKPQKNDVVAAVQRVLNAVPEQWHAAMSGLGIVEQKDDLPAWAAHYDAINNVANFEARHGDAARWNLDDDQICELAKLCAAQAVELDSALQGQGEAIEARLDTVLMLCRMVGVDSPVGITAEGVVLRAQDAKWWRRVLRVHVARVVEAGAVKLGVVNKRSGGYASNAAVRRRTGQLARNAEALKNTIFKNEAGQVWNLAELAALSVANPVVRGGELMTRIRGSEEYADAHGHIGLFVTLTCPSAMHPVTVGSAGRPRPNPLYDGKSTPRDAQLWLRKMWARLRAKCARESLAMYGIRVAEPHHDATPHWHALMWVHSQADAERLEALIRDQWLSEYGSERGAVANRVNIKAMESGGAAGYVAKYIAKSIGHHALADHLDMVQGELLPVSTGGVQGWQRVDAWASTWGIRQFQSFGMPGVGLWRALRRVSKDQADHARVTGDMGAFKAWFACHKHAESDKASWCAFVKAAGGMCLPRLKVALRLVKREGEKVNGYGETVPEQTVYGVRSKGGAFFVSRRMDWVRTEEKPPEEKARLAAPWTRFNNCTARLGDELQTMLFGLGFSQKWRARC